MNYIYIRFAARLQCAETRSLCVLGDDSGFFSTDFDVDCCAQDLGKFLDLELHPDMCEELDDPTNFKLLDYTYQGTSQTRKSKEWILYALCPSSFVLDIGVSMGRLFIQWLEGGWREKFFCRFWEYCQSGYPIPESGSILQDVYCHLKHVIGISVPSIGL